MLKTQLAAIFSNVQKSCLKEKNLASICGQSSWPFEVHDSEFYPKALLSFVIQNLLAVMMDFLRHLDWELSRVVVFLGLFVWVIVVLFGRFL